MAKSLSPQDIQTESKKAHLIAQHKELVSHWQNAQDVFTRLCRRLHVSLELDQCLTVFLEELRSVMAFNSFSYQHDQGRDSYVYSEGYGGQHHCEYNLTLQGEHLGYLSLNRRSRFAEEELMVLEQMIGILVFPLRNCWLHRQAQGAALTDSITLLGNKRALVNAMKRCTVLSSRHQQPLSVLICDLDHFKLVNDSYGHVFGDQVLAEVAGLIRSSVRVSDEAFRFGGEEFAVLLPHTAMNEAMVVAERIRQAVEGHPFCCGEIPVRVTVSGGVTEYLSATGEAIETFLGVADKALYRAKRDGRNLIRSGLREATLSC